jgi:Fis family transcriptional regulator
VNRKRSDSGTETLRECVERSLEGYFAKLGDHHPSNLYDLVIGEIEPPLLASVMRHCSGNQTRAATMLGLSRSTLRKKLRAYGIDNPSPP